MDERHFNRTAGQQVAPAVAGIYLRREQGMGCQGGETTDGARDPRPWAARSRGR